jgi:hypothetical protein
MYDIIYKKGKNIQINISNTENWKGELVRWQ